MTVARSLSASRVAVLSLAALIASVVPLPAAVGFLRPDFVALLLLWLVLLAPRHSGLVYAWCMGLLLDAFRGVLLGQHALALVLIAWIALRLRLRVRAFPLLQQTAVVFALLWLNEFVVFWIDGVAGQPVTDWMRWLAVPVGAACWPLLARLLERTTSRT
ncbi:MAG: rod shape-determining protein MreD [Gammaproteobacteria bacterium]|nr:rod shape-determining protein MreD [Gammaproteobacteria bacterium]